MRKNQSSMTAMGIAIVRGIESEKPENERICYDPYARRLVNGALYNFVRFFDKLGYSEIKGPGVMGFLTVRDLHSPKVALAYRYLFDDQQLPVVRGPIGYLPTSPFV